MRCTQKAKGKGRLVKKLFCTTHLIEDKTGFRGCCGCLIVLLLGMGTCIATVDRNPCTNGVRESQAKGTARRFVTQQLNHPGTADFPWEGWIVRRLIENHPPEPVWFVASYVDAKNAFGVTIRTRFSVKLKWVGPDSDDWKLIEFETW